MATLEPLRASKARIDDSSESVNDHFYKQGWTDGLPIVAPTLERIEAMIKASGRGQREVVARLALTYGDATVEKLAINAVMAGCEPSYMPVIITAIEAMVDIRYNLLNVQATTNPAGPMLIINGPIRKTLDINCSYNALGPGWKANATIGRAVRLILLNLGGGVPGKVDKSTQGMPGKYTFCFGENEEKNPWNPLHVDRGFKREESAVTVVDAHGTHNIHCADTGNVAEMAEFLAVAMINVGVNNFVTGGGEAALLLGPMHAAMLAAGGFTKESLQEYFFQHVRAPLKTFPKVTREVILERGKNIGDMVPVVQSPNLMLLPVVGGEGFHSTFIPTLAYGSVTRAIAPMA